MHQYALFSQIDAGRHKQVLQLLAGVTASQPVEFGETCLIYQQLKATSGIVSKKLPAKQPAQTPKLSYHKLVRGSSSLEGPGVQSGGEWILRIEEQPEAGVKNVISRSVSERKVDEATLLRFQPGSGWYKFANQYVAKGHRFVHGDVVVRVTRIFTLSQQQAEDPLHSSEPSKADLQPLDRSGTHTIEAYIATEDGATTELRDKAVDELLKFAKNLEGAIDFRVPNRLALDPNVKIA